MDLKATINDQLTMVNKFERRLKKRLRRIEEAENLEANGAMRAPSEPTACELAIDALIVAMIAKELACGPE